MKEQDYADRSDQTLRDLCARRRDALAYAELRRRSGDAAAFYRGFSLPQLVLLYWHGDRSAVDALYPRFQTLFYPRTRRLLAAGGGFAEQADDVFQKFCIDVLITRREQLANTLVDQTDGYFIGYLSRRLKWAVQDHAAADRAARPYAAADLDPDDLAGRTDLTEQSTVDEKVELIFSLIVQQPCDRRSLYLAYHYGTKLADLAVLTGEPENTVKTRVISIAGRQIQRQYEAIARGDRPAPVKPTPPKPDRLHRCTAAAEARRERIQRLFRAVDELLAGADPNTRRHLSAALAGERNDLTALTFDADRLADTLEFIRRLRQLPCEPREALICWDYLRQPLADVVRSTVNQADSAAADPVELAYRRWQQGAQAVIGRCPRQR